MGTRRLAVALVGALVLSGCASRGPDTRVTSLTTATPRPAASGALTLESAGFTYGPRSLALPPTIRIDRRVDQANVVSLFFRTPDGPAAAAFFREALPAAGMPLTADASGSLLCAGGGWSCAFTTGADGESGLTLRRDA